MLHCENPLSFTRVLFCVYDSDANINSIYINVMRDSKHGYRTHAFVTGLDTTELISGPNNRSLSTLIGCRNLLCFLTIFLEDCIQNLLSYTKYLNISLNLYENPYVIWL